MKLPKWIRDWWAKEKADFDRFCLQEALRDERKAREKKARATSKRAKAETISRNNS